MMNHKEHGEAQRKDVGREIIEQRIYDISRTISPTLAVWPSDSPFSYQVVASKEQGASVNLTTLTLSAHTGSHADAPWHYDSAGSHPADVPLDKYIGPAHVATITRREGGIIPEDFVGHHLNGMRRLLIHTWVSDLPDDQWPERFPYPTVALIDWLAEQGVVLLGVDMPSVDDFNSKTLDGHHRLLHHGIVNLESLNLRGVPDGVYELIALPLKIAGVCGSPVRAILRRAIAVGKGRKIMASKKRRGQHSFKTKQLQRAFGWDE